MKTTKQITTALFLSVVLLALLVSIVRQPVAAKSSLTPLEMQRVLTPLSAGSSLDKAYQHLEEVMDKYHQSFDVYTDLGVGGNHFNHLAMMECGVTIDGTFTETVHSGATAIKNTFTPQNCDWGGWYFQNGVLLENDVEPRPNWGDYPNAGYNLTGATSLTFWARGEQGGERVEFFAFGIEGDYPDSESKVSLGFVTLTNTWQQYTINLSMNNLSYVIGGFGWVASAAANNDQSITFYLDNIQYDKSRSNDLRLLLSFETLPTDDSFDLVNRNISFTYDNALALIAFTANENQDRAKLLADAFLYAQVHDRYYNDGRLRNAYQSGDLIAPPGWKPNGREGTARLPGWYDPVEEKWLESTEHVGSGTGNLAWVMIALLNYYEKWGGEEYLNAVIKLGNWIQINTHDTRGAGGYTGGYSGGEPLPDKLLWKSTEHNIDLYVAFERLYLITGDETWRERAQHARNFVEAMWNEPEGFYWTGTGEDGETINETVIPLDGQTWTLMAFGPNERTQRAIDYAEANHYASYSYNGGLYEGFDFNTDRDMPWAEGTGQMVVSYWLLEEDGNAQKYLDELREIQATDSNGNGKGIVAAPENGLTTGFDWEYFERLHVGATAWFIFGELEFNPYWPPIQGPTNVTITGPATSTIQVSHLFNASVGPNTATKPITYTWQATEKTPVTNRYADSIDTVSFTWNTTGTKTITVTAQNRGGTVSNTYVVTNVEGRRVYLPVILK